MRRDDDGFGPVSRAERRAADAFYAALMGRRRRQSRPVEAFAMPRPPLIERTYAPPPEPPAEDPPQVCGFFGPTAGTQLTLDQLRTRIAVVAQDQWAEWHNGPVLRLESEVSLFWLLVAYYVSANPGITADQVKVIHANATPRGVLSIAAVLPSTLTKDTLLKGISSPSRDLKKHVDGALENARKAHRDKDAWSAAFVSAVVRGAAIVNGVESDPTKPLSVSVKHIEYTKEALKRTPAAATPGVAARPGVAGTYHAFKPGDRDVGVGDIIVQDRRPRLKESDVTTLSLSMADDRISHGDIVVEVKADHVVTIGGNVCNSVRFRRYPVQNKRLVVQPNQLYVQENSRGQVPILPAESCHDPGDDLESQSTRRIFALLSLVEECRTPPAGAGSGG